jgi:hypothetical protein
MSWWVYLEDRPERPVHVDPHAEGGTYAVGGIPRAELNVTYNYGVRYREALPSMAEGANILGRMLDGKRAEDTLSMLDRVIDALGVERSEDYWDPTPGNAGAALAVLRDWARQHPGARWSVQ